MRCGDPAAGSRFVREHYPGIYRYLLYLTRRPEVAEDLTQETFLQAWRSRGTFDESASLRPWPQRIAHREFLQLLRWHRRQPEDQRTTSLEHRPGPAGAGASPWARRRGHGGGGGGTMERGECLGEGDGGAGGVRLSEPEKEIVESRLTQKVSCAFKGTALCDLCEKLKSDTGIHLTAGPSVADEKVTLFCEKRPLREVMRQLSRPFGYTWLRSGTPGQYRYELVQDLRSQLLEEELRNRDKNAALLALEQELEKYRPYLDLTPDEM